MSDLNDTVEQVEHERVGFIADGLHGQLSSWMVNQLKHLPSTFQEMSEEEQQDLISGAVNQSREIINDIVELIASDGRKVIMGKCKKVSNNGDQIEAQVICSNKAECRHDLVDAAGQSVMLVVADSRDYMGGDHPEPTPDQMEIPGVDDDSPVMDNTACGAHDENARLPAAE